MLHSKARLSGTAFSRMEGAILNLIIGNLARRHAANELECIAIEANVHKLLRLIHDYRLYFDRKEQLLKIERTFESKGQAVPTDIMNSTIIIKGKLKEKPFSNERLSHQALFCLEDIVTYHSGKMARSVVDAASPAPPLPDYPLKDHSKGLKKVVSVKVSSKTNRVIAASHSASPPISKKKITAKSAQTNANTGFVKIGSTVYRLD
ncbi:hypothetical protein ACFQZE_04730 [Paenibacillus sp. GCM10027627]|uniref:hypothetical protein n=1 Tax=unclassified Paenibacillus TaxID=185978 RepID=UPI00364488B8